MREMTYNSPLSPINPHRHQHHSDTTCTHGYHITNTRIADPLNFFAIWNSGAVTLALTGHIGNAHACAFAALSSEILATAYSSADRQTSELMVQSIV
jgi:hypothetical protein